MRVHGVRLALAILLGTGPLAAQETSPAKATYDRWCAGCHGVEGRGDGPATATMLPRPRDFTTGLYQIRTTPSGALPTDADILAVIDDGMPGTAMPGWKDRLSRQQREALVDYLKSFAPFFETEEVPEPIEIGRAPRANEGALAEGREFYDRIECWKCHGQAGRGDGTSAPTLEDDQDQPIRAVDLTKAWNFNGGSSAEAIYTRLRTGLDGTPMPSFSDLIDSEFMTDEQLWNVAQFVASLSPEKPRTREVVRAVLVDEDLPVDLDDPKWEEIQRFYIPLVGQVIVEPRWFAPSVDGVWVQAVHDGEELALLLTWHDPSQSPDPAWDEWRAKMMTAMAPDVAPGAVPAEEPAVDTVPAEEAPSAAVTEPDTTVAAVSATTTGGSSLGDPYDALVVQFPPTIPGGMERPYFLLGSQRQPVYLWVWQSGVEGAREAIGRGFTDIRPIDGEAVLTAQATFSEGRWKLLVRRSLAAPETEGRLQFEPGRAIPMAVFAWDGSNGESDTRGSISTWYFLYLDRPSGRGVYAWPVLATLLTAGLGLVLVSRAQRRARDASRSETG